MISISKIKFNNKPLRIAFRRVKFKFPPPLKADEFINSKRVQQALKKADNALPFLEGSLTEMAPDFTPSIMAACHYLQLNIRKYLK